MKNVYKQNCSFNSRFSKSAVNIELERILHKNRLVKSALTKCKVKC